MITAYATVLWAALMGQTPAGARVFTVDASQSTVRYTIVHKLHKVVGESKVVEGKVALTPDGRALVMVRVPVATFNSGDGNRDAHMLETLEAGKFPFVTFKSSLRFALPTALPAQQRVELDGQLDFHGRKEDQKIPLQLEVRDAKEWRVQGGFDVSLDKYQVKRPSLLFVKIEDNCHIDLDLKLKAEGP